MGYWALIAGYPMTETSITTSASAKIPPWGTPSKAGLRVGVRYECPTSPFKQNAGQLPGRGLAKIPASLDLSPVAQPHLPSSLWFRVQKLLSGPWVPGGGVSGRALAVAPDGKLLFSGGHWDGSLRVTSLPRGRLLNQLRRHLGMSSPGALENNAGRCRMGFPVGPGRTQHLCMSSPSMQM